MPADTTGAVAAATSTVAAARRRKPCADCGRRPAVARRKCAGCYNRERRARLADGTWDGNVDAAPVRERIQHLLAAGMAIDHIAWQAGVDPGGLAAIAAGKTRYTRAHLAAAINRVRPDPRQAPSRHSYVPAVGAVRRLQSLAAAGWDAHRLAERSGLTVHTIRAIHSARQTRVTTRHHLAIAAMWRDIDITPGPSVRAQLFAERRGWLPPIAWDEDTIDDPKARPSQGLRAPAPRTERRAERIATVHRLTRRGLSTNQIADQLGIHPRQVSRDRKEAS